MLDARITGRRPNRSDSEPCTGENRNCMSAQTEPNQPYTSAASAWLPSTKSITRRGRIGTIMPSASMSSSTVTRNKDECSLARWRDAVSVIAFSLRVPRTGWPSRAASDGSAFRAGGTVAQAVDEITLVGLRHGVGAGAENHKARRAGLGLRDVVELETPARNRRRRMRRACLDQATG